MTNKKSTDTPTDCRVYELSNDQTVVYVLRGDVVTQCYVDRINHDEMHQVMACPEDMISFHNLSEEVVHA